MQITVDSPTVHSGMITFRIIGQPRLDGLDGMTGTLSLDIKRYREKRSPDANAYCWVLLDKLSEAMRIPATEIYRNAIRDIGGVSTIVPIRDDAVGEWIEIWRSHGVGWMCEVIGPCKNEGYTYIKSYYGSSTYDTAQMSRLIDSIVQDCKAVGIETMTRRELQNLIATWEGKDGQK